MDYTGMLIYMVVAMATPGPNNLMSMFLCARHGFRGARKFMIGSSVTFLVKMLFCGLLNLLLATVIPSLVPYLKWLGAAYMLYLAFHIGNSGFHKEETADDPGESTESTYKSGVMLQTLNIKSWVFALSLFSIYVIPYSTSVPFILGMSLFALVGMVACTLLWGLFGSAIKRLYDRYRLPCSLVMAASLVYCAVVAVL